MTEHPLFPNTCPAADITDNVTHYCATAPRHRLAHRCDCGHEWGGVDTLNAQAVGVRGDTIVVLAPNREMTRREALVHAAWLVAVADRDDEFPTILEAVQST